VEVLEMRRTKDGGAVTDSRRKDQGIPDDIWRGGSRFSTEDSYSEHLHFDFKKYVTDCGLEWKDKPNPQHECEHIDCAMKVAIKNMKSAALYSILFIPLLIFGIRDMLSDFSTFLLTGFFATSVLACLFIELSSWKKLIELTEYKDKGTIDGIKANQIFDNLMKKIESS
jgi:hypothetical protein